MPDAFSPVEINDLQKVISAPRFATYLREKNNNKLDAMVLYQWNLEISSAFFIPLQVFEVAVRNSVADALEKVHGSLWPWSDGFIRSLPSPNSKNQYDPKKDLKKVSKQQPTTGKVIAELKFAFWQSIFTAGQDSRVWEPYFYSVFPSAPMVLSISGARTYAFNAIQDIRSLRNRIAHHEPVFNRNLVDEYSMIREIVRWKNISAYTWLDKIENVSHFLTCKP